MSNTITIHIEKNEVTNIEGIPADVDVVIRHYYEANEYKPNSQFQRDDEGDVFIDTEFHDHKPLDQQSRRQF